MGKQKPKREKIGPEDLLVEELRAVVTGRRPATEEWKKDHRGKAYLDGSGSGNWGPAEAAVKFELEPDSIRPWLAETFFPLMRSRFMITELMSLIYGSMHLAAFCAIAKTAQRLGDVQVLREARACTRLYLWILSQRQCPDGRVLVAGCRSAGHAAWEHGDPWGRWCLAIATGKGEREAFGGLKAAGEGPAKAWQSAVFLACSEQLRLAAEPFAAVDLATLGFRGATGLHILKCSDGLATWIESNVNSNTKPEMVSAWKDGQITTLPGPRLAAQGGGRVNRGWMEGSVKMEGDVLAVYLGHGETVRLTLPGAPGSHFYLPGPDGAEIPTPVDPPIDPPAPGPNIEALVAEVAALGAQPDQTEPAVALVRDSTMAGGRRCGRGDAGAEEARGATGRTRAASQGHGMSEPRAFPIQAHRRSESPARIPEPVYMAAYEVYAHVYGKQEAMIDFEKGCRGGFSAGEVVAFLYARSFPRVEWRSRVDEAFRGATL